MKTQLVSAHNGFLIDDFKICLSQKTADAVKQKVIISAAGLLSRIYDAHMQQVVPYSHERDIVFLKGVCKLLLRVHEAALARGVKVTGATVHFVDEGTDTGPILLQKAVDVLPGDTPEVLQRRVMEQAEWVILPQAIDMIANGKC